MDHSSSADHFVPFSGKNDSKFSKPLPRKNNSQETFYAKIEHNDKPHLHNLKPVTKTIKKESHTKRGYTFISDEVRQQLIEAVHVDGERIVCAAKRLGINYSAAKAICQVYKHEGRCNKKVPNRHVFPSSIGDSDRSFATDSEKPEIIKKEADEITISQEESFLKMNEIFRNSQFKTQKANEFVPILDNPEIHFTSLRARPTMVVPIYITNPVLGHTLPSQHLQASNSNLCYFKPQVDLHPHVSYQIDQELLMHSQPQKACIYTPALNIASSRNLNAPPYMLNSVYYVQVCPQKLNVSSTSVSQYFPNGYGQLSGPSNSCLDQSLIVTDLAMDKDLLLFRKNLL